MGRRGPGFARSWLCIMFGGGDLHRWEPLPWGAGCLGSIFHPASFSDHLDLAPELLIKAFGEWHSLVVETNASEPEIWRSMSVQPKVRSRGPRREGSESLVESELQPSLEGLSSSGWRRNSILGEMGKPSEKKGRVDGKVCTFTSSVGSLNYSDRKKHI